MNDLFPDAPESDEELLKAYDTPQRRADDAAAMQTALCIILAAALFIAELASPGTGSGILHRITELSSGSDELLPNPIPFIESLF